MNPSKLFLSVYLAVPLSLLVHIRMIQSVVSYFILPLQTMKRRREPSSLLPEKILLAYTYNNCQDLNQMDKVTRSIENGVNVLIWSFASFETVEVGASSRLVIQSSQNKENLIKYQNYLDTLGYGHVIHLLAFGGWNGRHLPSGYTSSQLFQTFQQYNEYYIPSEGTYQEKKRLFDGIDWDLEGHDILIYPTNEFTLECLNQMGEFSEKIHNDGLIVSMAPPESYLDISSPRFSRFVNHTYTQDNWHQDFQYHGWNVYAYLLAQYNHVFHFIFLQFYESYSHAAYHIKRLDQNPHRYIIDYMSHFQNYAQNNGWFVHFEDDPSIQMKSQIVSLDPNKLVLGFANGWALNKDIEEKTIFFNGKDIGIALRMMERNKQAVPRGVGFWVIEEEGTNDVYFANDLFNALFSHMEKTVSLIHKY